MVSTNLELVKFSKASSAYGGLYLTKHYKDKNGHILEVSSMTGRDEVFTTNEIEITKEEFLKLGGEI
jgi:hypothetical protein